MGIRIGIDLGTSNSSVAYMEPTTSNVAIIKNRYDMPSTPSVLAFMEDGSVLYGEDAKELQVQGYDHTISFFKRYMGVEEYEVEFFGTLYSATKLSAIFLEKLVEEVEEVTKKQVDDVVITVPAYFKHKERKATMEAAKLAGLRVQQIINEPTAAALSYGIHGRAQAQTVLIYDLGGGTLDVTIAKIEQDKITVLGVEGNHRLGGKEWDDALARWVIAQYEKKYDSHLFEDTSAVTQLLVDVEKVKKQLSVASSVAIRVGRNKEKETYLISQNVFEEITMSLLEMTTDCVERLFRQLSFQWSDLSGIILVGGATKMKMVRTYLEKTTSVPVLYGVNPVEAVALGAAICANSNPNPERILPVVNEYLPGSKKVEDVIAHSLGMITISEDGERYVNSIIIKKNSKIPTSQSKEYRFYTTYGENELEVYLLQGEANDPLECQIIGKYIFYDIPCLPGSKSVIEVTYAYNANGLVEVSAIQAETKEQLPMRIESVPEEIEWLRKHPKQGKHTGKIPENTVIYIAVDVSGSMKGGPLLAAKNAMYSFVHELNLQFCKVGIITFADRAKVWLPPTNKLGILERMIRSLSMDSNALGYCNEAHPFYLLYDEFEKVIRDEEISRKNAIIVTDGIWTNADQAVAAARRCHSSDIDVIALGFGKAELAFLYQIASDRDLTKFTELEELTIEFSKIAQEME